MNAYNYMDHININRHDPLISYYKSEYKGDWIVAYSNFIESKKKERNAIFFGAFKKIIHGILHPREKAVEDQLALSKTHHDVDILQRNMMQKSVI